jgi:hypothetical protein
MSKIYIVAGHGAGDPGAIGNGYKEADLTRRMAKDIVARIGDKAVLYPVNRDLYRAKDYSFFTNADYVLEIHFNSASNHAANGTELLIKQGFTPDNMDKSIYNAVSLFFAKRGIKTSSALANMNQFAKRGISYSLLEVCFICNANDMQKWERNYETIINNLVGALTGTGNAGSVPISKADEWVKQGDRWWYRHADGSYTISDWEYINGRWYYFDDRGWMITGWKEWKGKWYYLKGNGGMAYDEILQIGTEKFSFAPDGRMENTNQRGALE